MENSQMTLEEMKKNEEHLEQSLLQMKKSCEESESKAMFAAKEAEEIAVRMQEENLAELEQSRRRCEQNISAERSLAAMQERAHIDVIKQAEAKTEMLEKQHELAMKKMLFDLEQKDEDLKKFSAISDGLRKVLFTLRREGILVHPETYEVDWGQLELVNATFDNETLLEMEGNITVTEILDLVNEIPRGTLASFNSTYCFIANQKAQYDGDMMRHLTETRIYMVYAMVAACLLLAILAYIATCLKMCVPRMEADT